MRLLRLNEDDEVVLANEFHDGEPPYAILSHTWGPDQEEVTFADLSSGCGKGKPGYEKIRFCAERARKDCLEYFWVDTCCINKADLTELSESIISMFRWYRAAARCYVYLADVSLNTRDGEVHGVWETSFRNCRWFTRGWTLQELLAPDSVEFFSREGRLLGSKDVLALMIQEVAGIPVSALRGTPLSVFSVQERIGWAANRTTRKLEDKAYCLLGIFDVVMMPLYGEQERAMVRLKDEIGKSFRNQLDSAGPLTASKVPPFKTDTASSKNRERELLDSLYFEQMDTRQATIRPAYSTTCEWLLETEAYADWVNSEKAEQNGFFWIQGKPGAGKSTMIRYMHSQATESAHDDKIILSFYFNARGHVLEKTTLGMYRSLIFQLLQFFQRTSDLQPLLRDIVSRFETFHSVWTMESLRELLTLAVVRLNSRRTMLYFIDALDECDEQEIRAMIVHFEELRAVSGRLNVCFASRHYPTIDIRHGVQLILEHESGHGRDLTQYVQNHLRIGRGNDNILAQILEKANGVFLWAQLVIEILNEEYRRGRIFAVQKRANELPARLGDLFRDILSRDQFNMDALLLCLQWILFAERPLHRAEFYYAVAAGVSPDCIDIPRDPEAVTDHVIDRFVRDCSKGLAEVTKSDPPRVQFIHESVRDFLIKDGGLYELWPEYQADPEGSSHCQLSRCCQGYLAVDLTSHLPSKELPAASSKDAEELREHICDSFPLLQYAADSVFYHADKAVHKTEDPFLANFNLSNWIFVSNIMLEEESDRYTQDVPLLYLLAERGSARLIESFNQLKYPVPLDSVRVYRCPFSVALVNQHWDALRALLDPCNDPCVGEVIQTLKMMPQGTPGPDSSDTLHWALYNGQERFAEMLATFSHTNTSREDNKGRLPLELAAEKGYAGVIQKLILRGEDVNAANLGHNGSCSALIHAASGGNCEIVKLLLDAGADLDAEGHFYGKALHVAAYEGHCEVVTLLLEAGAAVNVPGGVYGNALQAASERGHREMVRLLLRAGADVDAQGGFHDNALQAASYGGHADVLKLLLDTGAKPDIQGGFYGNALQVASDKGHQQIVKLLMDAGADVNAQCGDYGNALQAASAGGHDEVVHLLLMYGAHVNARGGLYGGALQAASYKGHSKVVQLLLDFGADVNAQGGVCGNALQTASDEGHLDVVKLLLAWGANVNAGHALQAALAGGHQKVAKLLQSHGARNRQ